MNWETRGIRVWPYKVYLYCSDDSAKMEWDGTELTSYPPMYPHKCPVCGGTMNADYVYPRIEYRNHR